MCFLGEGLKELPDNLLKLEFILTSNLLGINMNMEKFI